MTYTYLTRTMTKNDIIVNIPTSTGNVTASAAVESSGTTMSMRQFSLPQAYLSQRNESSSSDKWGGCVLVFGGVSLLAYVAYVLMVFITTIIMLADGGWNDIHYSCGHNLRDTTLAMIIMLFLLGSGGKQKKYESGTMVGIGAAWLLTYGIMGSIMAYERSNASSQCTAYLSNSIGGVNSPQVVLINQLVLAWLNVVIALILLLIGCMTTSSD